MTTAASKEKNPAITSTSKHLFALVPDMINHWSNIFQSVIQHYNVKNIG